jgi:hypothetical protein
METVSLLPSLPETKLMLNPSPQHSFTASIAPLSVLLAWFSVSIFINLFAYGAYTKALGRQMG